MKIHLGVIGQVHGGGRQPLTTSKLAEILEQEYGIFSSFVAANAEWINGQIAEAMAGAAASALVSDEGVALPLERVAADLAHRLQQAIATGQIERLDLGPGTVPTRAALMGINHRFKSGLNNISPGQKAAFLKEQKKLPRGEHARPVGDRRPSFVDTGILLGSIRGWAE
ncbi:hypothetical protein [Bombella mellum]|uniref:Uncharacterized protein n=1 Tax=Bombella mellum TaxID=2039288 RepID=A0ABR5ZRQ5_9PROT|nr:hypothetical protein [Bombella mellum]MBA5726970.1 hypothetical protein [Bombella mellum]